MPNTIRTLSIVSTGAAPAAPAAAYSVSITAIPAPIARPVRSEPRSTERMRKSDSGPSCAATSAPMP
jgi:hypothetical protein